MCSSSLCARLVLRPAGWHSLRPGRTTGGVTSCGDSRWGCVEEPRHCGQQNKKSKCVIADWRLCHPHWTQKAAQALLAPIIDKPEERTLLSTWTTNDSLTRMPSKMADLPARLAARTGEPPSPLRGMRAVDNNTSVATRVIERRRTIGHGGCFVEGHKAVHFLLQTAAVVLLFAVLTQRCVSDRLTAEEAESFRQALNEKGYDVDINRIWHDSGESGAIQLYHEAKEEHGMVRKVQVGAAAAGGALAVLGGALAGIGATRFSKGNAPIILLGGGMILSIAGLSTLVFPLFLQVVFRGLYKSEASWRDNIESRLLHRAKAAEEARAQAAAAKGA